MLTFNRLYNWMITRKIEQWVARLTPSFISYICMIVVGRDPLMKELNYVCIHIYIYQQGKIVCFISKERTSEQSFSKQTFFTKRKSTNTTLVFWAPLVKIRFPFGGGFSIRPLHSTDMPWYFFMFLLIAKTVLNSISLWKSFINSEHFKRNTSVF